MEESVFNLGRFPVFKHHLELVFLAIAAAIFIVGPGRVIFLSLNMN